MGLNQAPKGGGLGGTVVLTALVVGAEIVSNSYSQYGYWRETGELAPCDDSLHTLIPDTTSFQIPHVLQACEDPGPLVLDRLIENFILIMRLLIAQGSLAVAPNDITGPGGSAPESFVAPKPPLAYRIDFQNKPEAL